jgi:hypothetical protein
MPLSKEEALELKALNERLLPDDETELRLLSPTPDAPTPPTRATLTLEPAQPGTYARIPDATAGAPSPWGAFTGALAGTQRLPGQASTQPAGQDTAPLVAPALGRALGPPITQAGLEPAVRGLYGLGSSAAATALGWPMDLYNLATMLTHFGPKSGQMPPLPGSSPQWKQALDESLTKEGLYTPPTPGSWGATAERFGNRVGQFLGPGRLGGPSAGLKRDVLMGTEAGVGEGLARTLVPNSETAGDIGAALGPLAQTGVHALTSLGFKVFGKNALRQQDVREALEDLGKAETAWQTATTQFEEATQRVTDGYGQVLQGQDARMRDLQQQVYTTQLAREQAATRAKALIERTTESTGLQTRAATDYVQQLRDQERAAKQGTEDAFTGLPGAMPPGPYPTTPGDIQSIGTAGKAAATQSAETLRGEREGSFTRFYKAISTRVERMEVATRGRQWASKAYDTWHGAKSLLFDATEAVTGNEPVVYLRHLHGTEGTPMPGPGVPLGTRSALQEAQQTGQGVPRGTPAMERAGRMPPGQVTDAERLLAQAGTMPGVQQSLSAEELQGILSNPDFLKGLTPEQRGIATQFLERMTTSYGSDVPVPFWLGRRLESALGALAYRGAKPIGTLQQGRARQLYWQLHKDMEAFYETPAGLEIAPQMQEAKQLYKDGIRNFNEGLMGKLLNHRPGQAESFLDSLWSTKSNEEMFRIRQNADPETWEMFQAYLMADLHRKASPGGLFMPERFESMARQLERNGKLDILFTPEQRAAFDAERQQMTAFTPSYQVKLRKALDGKAPEQVVPYVFAPGQVERTQNFRAISTPENYDAAVKAWVGTFLKDAPHLSEAQLQQRLLKMEPQLDTMFAAYPGTADQVRDLLQQYRQGRITTHALGRQRALASQGARDTRALGAEQGRLATEAAQRPVQAAEEAVALAQDALKRAELQHAEATAARTQDLTRVKETGPEAQALAAAQDELTRTQETLKQARLAAKQPETGVASPRTKTFLHGSDFLGSLGAIFYGVGTGHPWVALAGAGGVAYEAGRLGLGQMVQSPRGRQILEQGLRGKYGPKAATFAGLVVAPHAGAPPDASAPPPAGQP